MSASKHTIERHMIQFLLWIILHLVNTTTNRTHTCHKTGAPFILIHLYRLCLRSFHESENSNDGHLALEKSKCSLRQVCLERIHREVEVIRANNNRVLPWGAISNIVQKSRVDLPWL